MLRWPLIPTPTYKAVCVWRYAAHTSTRILFDVTDNFTDPAVSGKINGEHKEKDLEPWDGGETHNSDSLESLDTDVVRSIRHIDIVQRMVFIQIVIVWHYCHVLKSIGTLYVEFFVKFCLCCFLSLKPVKWVGSQRHVQVQWGEIWSFVNVWQQPIHIYVSFYVLSICVLFCFLWNTYFTDLTPNTVGNF